MPEPDLAADVPVSLRLEPLTGPDDPRLLRLHEGVMRGTLDAYDRALIDRVGLQAATQHALSDLLEAGPWQCIRLAFADGPEPVGLVSWRSMPGGRGYLDESGCVVRHGRTFMRPLLPGQTPDQD